MIENTRPAVPPDHPVRAVLHQLTDRAMKQLDLRDEETISYVADLLIDNDGPLEALEPRVREVWEELARRAADEKR